MLEHIGRVPRPSETMDAGSGAQLAPRPTARRLTVGSADDRAEHQADKIADRVIRAMTGIPQRPVALGPAELPSTDGCVRRRIDPGAVRSGSTTLKQNNLMGLTKDEEWDNPEELLNIENVENALRSESGLTERFGHRPPDYLLKLAPKVRVVLRKPLDMLGKHDHVRYKVDGTSDYGKLYLRMNGLKAEVATEPEEAAACADDVRAFVEAELTQLWITTNARKDAQDALDRIVPDLKTIFT